jgi:hypothetical protein
MRCRPPSLPRLSLGCERNPLCRHLRSRHSNLSFPGSAKPGMSASPDLRTPLPGFLHDGILRDLAVAAPSTVVHQVSAEDHAQVIKLKPLSCIHAPHLINPVRIGGPEVRFRNARRQLPASGIAFHAMPNPSNFTSWRVSEAFGWASLCAFPIGLGFARTGSGRKIILQSINMSGPGERSLLMLISSGIRVPAQTSDRWVHRSACSFRIKRHSWELRLAKIFHRRLAQLARS